MNWITNISFALTLYILIHISFLCLCYRWIIQVGSTTVVEYGKISDEMPKQWSSAQTVPGLSFCVPVLHQPLPYHRRRFTDVEHGERA